MTEATEAATRLLTGPVTGERRLGSSVYLLTTPAKLLIAKRGVGEGAAVAEAAGLHWLGEHGDVPVPEVLGYDDEWLVMEYVPAESPGKRAAEKLGRGLAALHLRGAPAYGSPPPGGPADAWMGLAPMRNEACADWASFYAAHRIEPYVRSCVDQGLFTTGEAGVFDTVCARLPELGGEPEPPSRLHGDAWTGNVLWGRDDLAWLIDPAAHGGHREADLAMLRMFGTPLLDHVLGGYAEAATDAGSPLADGWHDRVDLHQLFPLLMHAAVFGGGYARDALLAARKCTS